MGRITRAIASKKRSAETLLSVLPENSPARLQLVSEIARLDNLLSRYS